MKKRMVTYRRGKLPVYGLFFAGFLLGILIPNLFWKLEWCQKTVSSVYLLGIFAGQDRDGREYLIQVLKNRGSMFLLAAFCGISVFGVPLAVAGLLVFGLQTGMLLTMSVLEFGLNGGILGAGLLFPQYLVYVPAVFYLLSLVYGQSMEMWKNQGLYPKRVSGYFFRIFLCALMILAGIFLEVFCNPIVTKILINNLQIF